MRPEACFVVKTRILNNEQEGSTGGGAAEDEKGEKVFVNIVQSEQIAKPRSQAVQGGTQWSLPISLGPRRMEKDKNGSNLVQVLSCLLALFLF